jgi:hypothetical protein
MIFFIVQFPPGNNGHEQKVKPLTTNIIKANFLCRGGTYGFTHQAFATFGPRLLQPGKAEARLV